MADNNSDDWVVFDVNESEFYSNRSTRLDYNRLNSKDKSIADNMLKETRKMSKKEFRKIKKEEKYDKEDFLDHILTPDEDVMDVLDGPLHADSFSISTPNNKGFEDVGIGVNVFLTDKRLILLNTSKNSSPTLKNHFEGAKLNQMDVKYEIRDSFNFNTFNLCDIYGISMKGENMVKSEKKIKFVSYKWLIPLGAIIAFFAPFIMLSGFLFEDYNVICIPLGLFTVVIGIVLIVIGALYRGKSYDGPHKWVSEEKTIHIVTLSPKYRSRCSLEVNVNPYKHKLPEIVYWVKNLQNRCPAINDPKPFDTVMEV